MEGLKINATKFYNHLQHIYNIYGDPKENSSFSKIDALLFVRGKFLEGDKNCLQEKTSQLHEYILGYDFTESLISFTPKEIIFFVASKKKMILENIKRPDKIICPEVNVFLRNPSGDNEKTINTILENIITDCNKDKVNIGMIKSERGIGTLVPEFEKCLNEKKSIQIIDTPDIVDEIFEIKDNEEIENIKTASKFASMVLQYTNQKFETIIDEEKRVRHEDLSNDIKKIVEKEGFQKKFTDKYKLSQIKLESLEITTKPTIQSGGKYDLNPMAESDNNYLSSDIIICKANTRYKDYNANIIRTFMIEANKIEQTRYKILQESFNKLISIIKIGKKISDVYKEIKQEIISRDSELESHIPKTFGNGIGLEYSNSKLLITENNDEIFQKGNTLNIILSLENLKKESSEKTYTLQIADTIVIKDDNEKENFTEDVSKELSDIYYNMEDLEDENKIKNDNDDNNLNYDSNRIVTRHMGMKTDEKMLLLEKRKEHQKELLKRKNEEFRNKLINHSADLRKEIEETKVNYSHVKSYDNINQFPSELKSGKIYIDKKNYTIFFPIFKKMVPFHVSLIKNSSKTEDNQYTVLRINFIVPGGNVDFGEIKGKNPIFVRELSYKSKFGPVIQNLLLQIRELSKNYKAKLQENKEKSDLVAQDHLIINKSKRIVLNDVSIRPTITGTGKKTIGVLEAHTNGLRFVSNKGEKVEIIYKNIKHAFLQPCENELIALIHFYLKNPIIIGKKKTFHVQFYKEAGSQADDLDNRRKLNDYEEYEIELREQQMRKKINNEFFKFANSIQDTKVLEFDIPFREMEFTGVPNRSNVTLLPTKYCLVSLVELPFFVLTLSEVEIVYFERVSQSLKNFDMAFIFKDLNKPFHRITTIPMENLDMLKSWLDENDILYGEGLYNMRWAEIIQNIKSNPQSFLKEGGWNFIQENDESNSSSDEKNIDSDYEVGSEQYEESESEYSEENMEDESESEGEDEGESALSEKGMSWDELEKDAIKSDKEHARRHKEEEDEKKGKKKRK